MCSGTGGQRAGPIKSVPSTKPIITTMYLQTLNRPPTNKELDNIGKAWTLLDKNGRQIPDKDPYARYHDLLWALVNSNEFNLNH